MLKKLLCGASLLCAAGFSQAASVSFTQNIMLQTTNFNTTLSFSDFDTMGGNRVLNSVSFSILGVVIGDAKAESTDNRPSTLVTTLSAEIAMLDLNDNLLVVTIPTVQNSFNASIYDNVTDFGGTSGVSYTGVTASNFESKDLANISPTMLNLASFTNGLSNDFVIDTRAMSSATGAGNIVSQFSTMASAEVTITYTYDDLQVSVNSPASLALLVFGLVGMASMRRFRK
jgi:hypothetical protein